MRFILALLAVLPLASCDRDAHSAAPVAVQLECTPMPAECPAQLACEVTTQTEGGKQVRVCGGTSCCQSFCEENGCDRCCATPAPEAP